MRFDIGDKVRYFNEPDEYTVTGVNMLGKLYTIKGPVAAISAVRESSLSPFERDPKPTLPAPKYVVEMNTYNRNPSPEWAVYKVDAMNMYSRVATYSNKQDAETVAGFMSIMAEKEAQQ